MNATRPRRRHPLRAVLLGIAALIGLAIAAGIAFVARFDANAYKPRIIEAVKNATGRDIALNGPIRLAFSLHPTIEVHDVALTNPPGFSRPDMARIQAVDLRLALLPLISRRVEIDRLVLIHPDILLETTQQGAVNWQFARPPSPTPTQPQTTTPTQPAAPGGRVSFGSISIQDGTIAYRDDRTGHVASVLVHQLDASAASPTSPLHLSGQGSVGGLGVTVTADTGSVLAVQAPQAGQSWPVKATLSAAGAMLHVDGAITLPLVAGYAMAVQATIPDLAALTPLAPNARLPPVHDLVVAAKVAGSPGTMPSISALTAHAGASDLSAFAAGLKLTKLDVSAPALDQPVHADNAGTYANQPLTMTASLGAPAALLHGTSQQPFPIDIAANAAGGQMTVKGGIADPAAMTGLDLAIDAHTADLAALAPLAGRPLPALRDVAFQGRLNDPNGITNGITLQSAKLTSAQGDIEGTIAAGLRPRPSIHAQIASQRIDADALRASLPHAPAAPAPAAQQAPKQAPLPPAHQGSHLIPDTKIPFESLRGFDADVTATIGSLIIGGEAWHAVAGHLVVQDGKLRLDPFKATLPAGAIDLTATADAGKPAPAVSLRMHAPAVALKAVLAALREPAYASGTVAISADLNGAGDSPHAIAASLDGTLSLAMEGGAIDTALLERALGPVIARANPAGLLARGGSTSDIRCLAARFQARHGIATLDPFLLSSSLITVDGNGRVDLASETLDLHLHPQGRVGGTGFSVPLTVTGSFAAPHVAMNESGVATKGFEAVIGAISGKNNPLAALGGPAAPSCAAALAAARGTAAPAAPANRAPAKPAARPAPKLPDAGKLLKQLLR